QQYSGSGSAKHPQPHSGGPRETDGVKTTPVLSDPEMRALGFTDHRQGHWYFVTRVNAHTTLNISINKKTGEYREDVLDEIYSQPAYYGRMKEPFRTEAHDSINAAVARLNEAGLDIEVDPRSYGWERGT